MYIQTVGPAGNGVIPGSYIRCSDLVNRIKAEGQRVKANTLLVEQQRRAELEDARASQDAVDAEAAAAKALKKAKAKEAKVRIL